MEQTRDLLIQVAIVILPLFLYETIRLSRHHLTLPKPNPYFVVTLSSITVVLCMTYPIHFGGTYEYDFYQIPIISAFLYAGPIGVAVPATAVLYHAVLYGTEGLSLSILNAAFSSLLPFLLWKRWSAFPKRKKIGMSFIVASFYTLSYLFSNMFWVLTEPGLTPTVSQMLGLHFIVSAVMACTMTFQVYLMEYLYENAMLRVEMFKSEKLNIVSELAASVAHEVRNPLTVVRGFIQLLEGAEKGKNGEYLRLVLNELDRAEQIISDYLNLARPQIEEMKPVCMSCQLKELTSIMSSFAALQGVYLQTEIAKNLHTFGDKTRLKQAVMNVIKNGVEAIGENKGYLKVTARGQGGEVVIKVKDSGVGMTNEQLERLGQPYYSLKEKGTGLGLMVTFSIIEAHHGTIEYKSEVGRGTEVIITLPAVPE